MCFDAVMAICGFVLCVSTLLSQHPTRNNFEYLEKIFFFKWVFRETIGDFTELHNENKSIWKLRARLRATGTVSVTGTRVNIYQIL